MIVRGRQGINATYVQQEVGAGREMTHTVSYPSGP